MQRQKSIWIIYLLLITFFSSPLTGCDDNDEEAEPEYPEILTDIDGNQYETVLVGDNLWMAENLSVTHYSSGDEIPTGLENDEWLGTSEGAFAVYPHEEVEGINSEENMVEAYGKLYNWFAVDDPRGLCPKGWRIPTDEELNALTDYISNNIQAENMANALKSCRQVNSPLGGECDTEEHPRWNEHPDHHGTDALGFNALPAGNRQTYGGTFENIGHWWTIWSSTEYDGQQAIHRWIRSNSGNVFDLDPSEKQAGYSVRCVWDPE